MKKLARLGSVSGSTRTQALNEAQPGDGKVVQYRKLINPNKTSNPIKTRQCSNSAQETTPAVEFQPGHFCTP
jgi:hypothetical protein